MKNITQDFKNYILNHTNPNHISDMADLLDNKSIQEALGQWTPSRLIDFMTAFYSFLEPEAREAVADIMDVDGHIRVENYYLFKNATPVFQVA